MLTLWFKMTTFKSMKLNKIAVAGFLALTSCFAIPHAAEFVDITKSSGVDFRHESGRIGDLGTVEITGSGVAVFDFDNDGWLDIWLVQGGPLKNRDGELPSDQLYRNTAANGELRFENVMLVAI